MTRLYLIRHARPAAAWGGADEDPGLDETGRAQARAAAAVLLALPAAERPTMVASSPLRRCRETAQPFADALGVPLAIDADVGEIPTPAALTLAERPAWLQRAFTGAWGDIQGDLDYEAWRRAVTTAVAARPRTAIFSHFVAINAVLSVLRGHDRVMDFRPGHVSITTLEVGPRGLALIERGAEAATGVL